MVLHLVEFTEAFPIKGKNLNHYDKLPQYLHEMSVDDILKEINRNGTRSRYMQYSVISEYFSYLYNKYGIDVAVKNFEIQQQFSKDNKTFVGFYDLTELKQAIEKGFQLANIEDNVSLPDYSGLKAIFFLEWFGILPESAVTIKLSDVSNDGAQLYVPVEDRIIEISDKGVAEYFAEYKAMTGFKRNKNSKEETPYAQSTFYRNTSFRNSEITPKTIYNVRQKFITACGDKRFAKKRIYYSGRYNEMYRYEEQNGEILINEEGLKVVRNIFNKPDLQINVLNTIMNEYKVYRTEYIDRL